MIDAHHHFWNYSKEAYGWIPDGTPLQRDYTPADLKLQLDASGVDGVISVQARTSLVENDFLLDHAETHDWIRGVVGWLDLTAEPRMIQEQLAQLATRPKLRGIRHTLQGEPDDYALRDDFNRGVALLHGYGFAYDVLIVHRQLANAIQFVDRHPVQVFVLDHIAKPDIQSATPDPKWIADMRELGKREHVFCKFSGVVTEIADSIEKWTPELIRPYFDIALEAFGADRLMFGSDWPVCRLRTEYVRWAETVKGFTSELSKDERGAVLGGNALRAYSIN